MSEKELPPYLTIGLHGIHDSKIVVTLHEYMINDGQIDRGKLEEDGYGTIVKYEGDFTGCWIPAILKGDTMKVEIFPLPNEKNDARAPVRPDPVKTPPLFY